MKKGNYYKIRTKNWFIKKGYQCELLERLNRIYLPKTKQIIFQKKDVFGADGLAMNKEEIIFWNAKFGKKNIASGIKEFKKFEFPSFVKLWLIVWEYRKREPEIVEVN